MSPGKGVHRAVRVARRTGWPLVISARIREPAERDYFDQQVRPLLGPDDDMLAEQPLAARALRPGDGPGTGDGHADPGVPQRRGTGDHRPWPHRYLCRDEDEMTDAVARVRQISRRQCRAAAQRRFSLARMAADYDRLYRAILEHPGRPAAERTGTSAL
jgi:hypothetical protein